MLSMVANFVTVDGENSFHPTSALRHGPEAPHHLYVFKFKDGIHSKSEVKTPPRSNVTPEVKQVSTNRTMIGSLALRGRKIPSVEEIFLRIGMIVALTSSSVLRNPRSVGLGVGCSNPSNDIVAVKHSYIRIRDLLDAASSSPKAWRSETRRSFEQYDAIPGESRRTTSRKRWEDSSLWILFWRCRNAPWIRNLCFGLIQRLMRPFGYLCIDECQSANYGWLQVSRV